MPAFVIMDKLQKLEQEFWHLLEKVQNEVFSLTSILVLVWISSKYNQI